MGRKSSRVGVEHFGTGVTAAHFQTEGTVSDSSDLLNKAVSGSAMTWAAAL